MDDDSPARDDVEILAKETPFAGFFRVDRYRFRHRRFDGDWSPPITREVFERGHAAAVLPYDPGRDEVVLIEQFRLPALIGAGRPWQVEIVAGILGDQLPEQVVRREAIEEAGLQLDGLLPICRFLPSPGGSSEAISLFLARVDSSLAGGVHGLAAEHENIRVLTLPFTEAQRRLAGGEIESSPAVIALL